MITWYLWVMARALAVAKPIPWFAPLMRAIVLAGGDIILVLWCEMDVAGIEIYWMSRLIV